MQQFKFNTQQMWLNHTIMQHRGHEACCTTVFSQIVKRLGSWQI